MRLLSRVAAHVHYQHILRLEGFFTPRTALPAADEGFLVALDVIVVDMLNEFILREELNVAIVPVTISLNKITGLILNICCIRCGAIIVVHGVLAAMMIIFILSHIDDRQGSSRLCSLPSFHCICR